MLSIVFKVIFATLRYTHSIQITCNRSLIRKHHIKINCITAVQIKILINQSNNVQSPMGYGTRDSSWPFSSHHSTEHELHQVFFYLLSAAWSSGYSLWLVGTRSRVRIPVHDQLGSTIAF